MKLLCHACGHHRGASIDGELLGQRLPHFTIDMHCHLAVEAVDKLVQDEPQRGQEVLRYAHSLGPTSTDFNRSMQESLAVRLVSAEQRVRDMDRLGVDLQVLSPSPMQYHYWAEPALAGKISRLINTHIAEAVASTPGRFVGLGHAPLQHPALAAEMLREAMAMGLRGVEISSDPTGKGLDDPELEIFWQAAAELRATLFLHPMGTSLGARLNRYYLANLIGQPLETTIALSQLIFSGVLDRHDLRLCAAHGGGYLPFAPGRLNHGHGVRPEAQGCRDAPGAYLSRVWFDTVVFSPQAVRTLIDHAGVGRVVAGTDYPYDMGEYALHALIAAVPGLTPEEQAAILGGNALELLGLSNEYPLIDAVRGRLARTS